MKVLMTNMPLDADTYNTNVSLQHSLLLYAPIHLTRT